MRALLLTLGALAPCAVACTTHHWAQVNTAELPPPPGAKVLHSSRLVVHVPESATEPQCLSHEEYQPVCFFNLRASLEKSLPRALWPSFPEVVLGSYEDAGPGDYFLQVDVTLDALPPDAAGPGWSAGARSRARLLRDGQVLWEETTSSRSRPEFAYGAPLGLGASEVVDATVLHIATRVSEVEEAKPFEPTPLPAVAARPVATEKKSATSASAPPAPKTREAATTADDVPDLAKSTP